MRSIRNSHLGGMVWPALVLAAVLGLVLLAAAVAQPPLPGDNNQAPPAQPPMPGMPGMPGMRGMPMMPPMAPGMMPGMMPSPPSVAMVVDAGKIYIAEGGTLYKFDAETLELEKKTRYAQNPPGPVPGMPPQPPGR